MVGAQRCGTTSLTRALGAHPQVALAEPLWPEPKWFLAEGSGGRVADYLAAHHPTSGEGILLRLEKSASYFESDTACREIATAFPGADIVVLLRDPVDRAVSNHAFTVANGLEDLSLLEALDPVAEGRPWDEAAISVSPYRYLSRGRYIEDLRRWDRGFGPDRVHVVLLEDLRADPEVYPGLVADLGLAPGSAFPAAERHNASEHDVVLDERTRARLASWFADANAALAERLGRPLDRWTHA